MRTYESSTGLFTPILPSGVRARFSAEHVEIIEDVHLCRRLLGYQGKVRIAGVVYNVFGEDCGLPNCNCDARLEIDEPWDADALARLLAAVEAEG